ncbi:MAG: hypothetical protein JNK82_17085 [Myxococcaceae bacterium]|nr:hypothetical protein [Myxococcaceae bacterium]
MGLDLYAGPLTRYYAGDWLTTMQRVGQELGLPTQVMYSDGQSPWLPADEAALAVKAFIASFGDSAWREEPGAPYTTDKPDRDGVFALDVFAAYLARPELVRPKVLPDLGADPAVSEANDRGHYMKHMVAIEAHLFVPGDGRWVKLVEDPLGAERVVTTVGTLEAVLHDLNARTWKASAAEIEAWRRRGHVPCRDVETGFDDATQRIVQRPYLVVDRLEHNAQFGLSCFFNMCAFSRRHGVPIVIDQ